MLRLFLLLSLLLLPVQGWGAWTLTTSVEGYAAASGTAVSATAALNVLTNDLIVCYTGWQGAVSGDTVTVDENDGTDTFTTPAAGKTVTASDIGGAMSYLIVTGDDASFTPRFTLSAAGTRRWIACYQFRPDASETVSVDGVTSAGGTSTSLNSGNITTTGTDEVVFGGGGWANGGTLLSDHAIGGVADDGNLDDDPAGGIYYSLWYRILTGTMTDGAATATAVGSDNWTCSIIAFKSEAGGGGGGGVVPKALLLGVGP